MTKMVEEITFKSGERAGSPPLTIRPGNVVVFVGPENSGKSLALREIESFSESIGDPKKVISSITHTSLSIDEIKRKT